VDTGQEAVVPAVQRIEPLQQDEQFVSGGMKPCCQRRDRVGELLNWCIDRRELGARAVVSCGMGRSTGCE
jgi:hypothetical protein